MSTSFRTISVPPPVTLTGPGGDTMTWTFQMLVSQLMANPRWVSTLASTKAQAAVVAAMESPETITLTEHDWGFLKAAVEEPLMQVNGPSGPAVVPGIGVHPSLNWQLLPLMTAITDAKESRG